MLVPKYIAAGFIKDAERLLKEFILKGSLDFSSFCTVWKKHNFSYIFMLRTDEKELAEFVNETYQLTLNHMLSLNTEFQIGALYLLYALFQNQEIITPIRIRVTLIQFRVIMHVWDYAQRREIRSLQYIVEYLCANCLEFVACSALFGPCGTKTKNESTKKNLQDSSILTDLKLNVSSFYENDVLNELKSLHTQYLETKQKIMPCREIAEDIIDSYERLNNTLENLIGLEKNKMCKIDTVESIGSRRIEIKSASFRKRTKYYRGQTDEEVVEDIPSDASPTKRGKRKKRVPPEMRKIGRPKKGSYSSEDSEFDEKPRCSTPSSPTKRGPIGRRKVSYLKKYDKKIVLKKPKLETEVGSIRESSSEESSGDVRF